MFLCEQCPLASRRTHTSTRYKKFENKYSILNESFPFKGSVLLVKQRISYPKQTFIDFVI